MKVAHVCLPGGGYSDLVVKNGNFTHNTGLIEVHACIEVTPRKVRKLQH